jgi:hypothetical protein
MRFFPMQVRRTLEEQEHKDPVRSAVSWLTRDGRRVTVMRGTMMSGITLCRVFQCFSTGMDMKGFTGTTHASMNARRQMLMMMWEPAMPETATRVMTNSLFTSLSEVEMIGDSDNVDSDDSDVGYTSF